MQIMHMLDSFESAGTWGTCLALVHLFFEQCGSQITQIVIILVECKTLFGASLSSLCRSAASCSLIGRSLASLFH